MPDETFVITYLIELYGQSMKLAMQRFSDIIAGTSQASNR